MVKTEQSKGSAVERPRREWGAERPRPPLPSVEKPASHAATWMGGFAIVVTVALWLGYLERTILSNILDGDFRDSSFIAQTAAYVLVMTLLTFSALMYLMARQGSLHRTRTHHRVPRAEIDAHFESATRAMTVLIPSYREDPEVVRATMLSAALQEYPDLRIVLLIDDPVAPTDPLDVASLEACRALPGVMAELLREPRERFTASLEEQQLAALADPASAPNQLRALALDYVWAADWLDFQAATYARSTHVDDFVADKILGGLGNDCRETAAALFAALDLRAEVPAARLVQMSSRLAWIFSAEFTSFERKAFAHLPHDANKAMNLNAYLGLMGGSYKVVKTRVGNVLRRTTEAPDLVIPLTDYILTLDADSLLLREYCLRLTYHLELPGNERIAVIQTPYSAFRGAPTRLERIAGATTDTQFIVHQGLTYYDATFWVGANAVIRWEALLDLQETTYVDGYEVKRFVQDRTVIEDTESSVDLVAHGWTLFNYPERLSYSATPPDFGSLVVQRARWANGGLLILPKLIKHAHASRKAGHRIKWSQYFLRFNYMASIAWASVGLVFLLAFPFNSHLLSPIILLAALPYFIAMGYDFHRMGYKRSDVFRVYAFNLILVPVNLAGTFKSLQQAAAKSKIPFARTPKVKDRTAAPALFLLGAYLIAGFSAYTFLHDLRYGNYSNATFAAFNGLLTLYAIVAFIGVRNSIVDIFVGMVNWVHVPVRAPGPSPEMELDANEPSDIDWEAVLYFGPGTVASGRSARGQGAAVTSRPPRSGDTRSRVRTEQSS